jgi:hypothetical protein
LNAKRRTLLLAITGLVSEGALAGRLGRLAEAVTGRRAQNTALVILVDQSASVNAEDATIYRQAFSAFSKTLVAGDRALIGTIADRPISRFIPLANRSAERKGIALDDREAVGRMRKELESDFARALVPTKAAQRTFILDAVNAAGEILRNARQERKRLVLLTDGIEESPAANFARQAVDAASMRRLIERRKKEGLLPQLKGVEVWLVGLGGRSNSEYSRLRTFWAEYFAAGQAKLVHAGRTVPEVQ